MFLVDKYRPASVNEMLFNKEIMQRLIFISQDDGIPHIIIAGPPNTGKKTLVGFFLENIYGKGIRNLRRKVCNIKGSSNKKEVTIFQSDYHIVIEPGNNNYDKYILQEIIKQYATSGSICMFEQQKTFKTIVIYNIENLAKNAQFALRRTMEQYAKTCRFIMVCNDLSAIYDPVRSRSNILTVPSPTREKVRQVITHVSRLENIDLDAKTLEIITNRADRNVKIAMNMLDLIIHGCSPMLPVDIIFDRLVNTIMTAPKNKNIARIFDFEIRTSIYDILITNIRGTDIITALMDRLIERIDDVDLCSKIIQHASDADINLTDGRREIMHIDYFILGVIREIIHASK
jgi:replication factor C subunit 3/5